MEKHIIASVSAVTSIFIKKINLLNRTISFADFHILWEHKRHLANTLKYMINRRLIVDNKGVYIKQYQIYLIRHCVEEIWRLNVQLSTTMQLKRNCI